MSPRGPLTRLYSIPELAEILNVPEEWVRKAVTARRIPFCYVGRHVRFSEEDLQAILDMGRRHLESQAELPRRDGRRTKL